MYSRLLIEKIPKVTNASELIPAVTLSDGNQTKCTDTDISVHRDSSQQVIFRLSQKSPKSMSLEMAWPDLKENLDKIMLSYFYEDYARIKEHPVFRRIYSYAEREVNYFDQGKVGPRICATFPCMNCGIVLPEHAITIDHDKPQKNGELLALLKVFRACGLTLEGPSGRLGLFYADHAVQSFAVLAGAITAPHLWPILEPGEYSSKATNRKKRETLNSCGTLIYSVLLWSEDIKLVMKNCMNSLLNLKPLCLSCNASKSNAI